MNLPFDGWELTDAKLTFDERLYAELVAYLLPIGVALAREYCQLLFLVTL